MMKKVLGWGLLAFLVFFIVTRPNDAASVMRSLGSGLMDVATGFGNFVSGLT
ncbi:MAG TPA: hypothetical protein VGR21_06995 [Cryptosporangiaceae bacterium]|nr:hypothetical protein [Cryptosporangiaceae bacterium]